MTRSIKYFLLISLMLAITLSSAINGMANYLLDEQVIQPYLDSQLVRISTLIDLLNKAMHSYPKIKEEITNYLQTTQTVSGQKFLFQIWDDKGNLLMHSSNLQAYPLKDAPLGFADIIIFEHTWRSYATYNPELRVKIVVAELYNLRQELRDDIARSDVYVLLFIYPIFGILVWIIIRFALRSITRVTNEISNRASAFLDPVELHEIPDEIKPLVAELNKLFTRLKSTFERNKRFAADAAHELKTPLAALKTHVQLALKSDNEIDRNKALENVISNVDRSSHVVTQLLTLSRLTEEENLSDIKPVDLHKLATEIIAFLAPSALEKNIEIELMPSPSQPVVLGDDTSLGILIRNLVDNAIRYTPPGGEVKASIIKTHSHVILRVIDTGTGIPPELHGRVFERFYRILGTKSTGSGLGLAIVNQIALLHHARLSLSTPQTGIGLQFDVAFPKYTA